MDFLDLSPNLDFKILFLLEVSQTDFLRRIFCHDGDRKETGDLMAFDCLASYRDQTKMVMWSSKA